MHVPAVGGSKKAGTGQDAGGVNRIMPRWSDVHPKTGHLNAIGMRKRVKYRQRAIPSAAERVTCDGCGHPATSHQKGCMICDCKAMYIAEKMQRRAQAIRNVAANDSTCRGCRHPSDAHEQTKPMERTRRCMVSSCGCMSYQPRRDMS